MLLPSAISCDTHSYPHSQPQQSFASTSLPRKTLFSPPHRQSSHPSTPSANIFAACNALQSLLTHTLPLPPPLSTRPSSHNLNSPITLHHSPRPPKAKKRYPPQPPSIPIPTPTSTSTLPPLAQHPTRTHLPTPPPTLKRRRTSSSSSSSASPLSASNKENTHPHPYTYSTKDITTPPTTPKRKRHCPPSLPLGLAQEDFALLDTQPAPLAPGVQRARRQQQHQQQQQQRRGQRQQQQQHQQQQGCDQVRVGGGFQLMPDLDFTTGSTNTPRAMALSSTTEHKTKIESGVEIGVEVATPPDDLRSYLPTPPPSSSSSSSSSSSYNSAVLSNRASHTTTTPENPSSTGSARLITHLLTNLALPMPVPVRSDQQPSQQQMAIQE